ncbi:Bifunctional ligase/repressor BirA [Polystyrenella longa]|uniref:biotin--[biotin carboxyl-carrier protein] ligase n=1 Tax=Polystyrenella longa TaxID=2528007 RepID=A0A518CQ24_9PLAN|nr:biotin--[acetyl-CoA-carboxylase] ligase [Polystyrenella longa]QDU81332.1 Bifunctional ligase/repressor BirA [Polystyrenella longa]
MGSLVPDLNSFSALCLNQIQRETFINDVDFHQEIESTNTQAALLCKQKSTEPPTLILTERQTKGRGRGRNQWWAQAGCLTFSVIVDASNFTRPEHLPLISLSTGWAIADLLEDYSPTQVVQLKWPNDVYMGTRKICGILTEMPSPDRVIVGIGLNVNNSFHTAPDQLKERATSLFDQVGDEYPLTTILIDLLKQLEQTWTRLAHNDLSFIERWSHRCLLTGRTITHEMGDQQTIGLCQGIDKSGALLLRTEHKVERLIGGTIVAF